MTFETNRGRHMLRLWSDGGFESTALAKPYGTRTRQSEPQIFQCLVGCHLQFGDSKIALSQRC